MLDRRTVNMPNGHSRSECHCFFASKQCLDRHNQTKDSPSLEVEKADFETKRKLGDIFGNGSDNKNGEDRSESDQSDNESKTMNLMIAMIQIKVNLMKIMIMMITMMMRRLPLTGRNMALLTNLRMMKQFGRKYLTDRFHICEMILTR